MVEIPMVEILTVELPMAALQMETILAAQPGQYLLTKPLPPTRLLKMKMAIARTGLNSTTLNPQPLIWPAGASQTISSSPQSGFSRKLYWPLALTCEYGHRTKIKRPEESIKPWLTAAIPSAICSLKQLPLVTGPAWNLTIAPGSRAPADLATAMVTMPRRFPRARHQFMPEFFSPLTIWS